MNTAIPLQVVFFDLGDTLISTGRTWVPGAKNALEALLGAGARLGIISNTGNMTVSQIEALFPPDFEVAVFKRELVKYSSVVGYEKPDPRIFEEAIRAASVSPGACLFCTESARDTIAAQMAGMIAYRLSNDTEADYRTLVSMLTRFGLRP